MKIAINNCIGGFTLSAQAIRRLMELNSPYIRSMEAERRDPEIFPDYVYENSRAYYYSDSTYEHDTRTNSLLLQVLEELGEAAFGGEGHDKIKVVEIPDHIEWEINEADDGYEWVAEKHRTWS